VIRRLEFASCYVYSPRGTSPIAEQSRTLCRRIKAGDEQAFGLAADRVRTFYDAGRFRRFFGPEVTLVPVPGRAPLVKGAVARTQRLADALLQRGLAAETLPLVERKAPVPKSAYAAPGERPTAETHWQSFTVPPVLAQPRRILLVDDVITRGATLIGAASRLAERYEELEILAFGLIRTQSTGEPAAVRDPCEGFIELDAFGASARRP
jgi:hypothetical protein